MVKIFFLMWSLAQASAAQLAETYPRAPMDVSQAQTFLSIQGDRVHTLLGQNPVKPEIPAGVLACLATAPDHITTKGLSTLPGAPDLIAQPGEIACRPFAPVPHQIILWSRDPDGTFHPRLQISFDLRGETGNILWIDWHREAPVPMMEEGRR